jgi:hypothetical protein
LHCVVMSWKYMHCVLCKRFPPVVVRLRRCPEAPANRAGDSTG